MVTCEVVNAISLYHNMIETLDFEWSRVMKLAEDESKLLQEIKEKESLWKLKRGDTVVQFKPRDFYIRIIESNS